MQIPFNFRLQLDEKGFRSYRR